MFDGRDSRSRRPSVKPDRFSLTTLHGENYQTENCAQAVGFAEVIIFLLRLAVPASFGKVVFTPDKPYDLSFAMSLRQSLDDSNPLRQNNANSSQDIDGCIRGSESTLLGNDNFA